MRVHKTLTINLFIHINQLQCDDFAKLFQSIDNCLHSDWASSLRYCVMLPLPAFSRYNPPP
jgi:hypothetical protein